MMETYVTACDTRDGNHGNCQSMNVTGDFLSDEDGGQVESHKNSGETPEKHDGTGLPCENEPKSIEKETVISKLKESLSANKLTFPDMTHSVQQTDGVSKNGGMNVSHTESGYLTDSVISRERDCACNSVGSSNSEQDVTPCAENLMTFSTSSSNTGSSLTSPVSPGSEVAHDTENSTSCSTDQASVDTDQTSSDTEDHVGQVNKIYNECTEIINQTVRIEQLESLARINLNCDREDINDIFATNFAPVRPESLVVKANKGDAGGARGRCHSEAFESLTDKVYVIGDQADSRKRSKSSGYPIPRQKEGVAISEDMLSKSLPHGKVVKSDSGLIEFIADDLLEKIRRSSPMSKTASSDVSSRRSSMLSLTSVDSMASSSMATSMTSGMSRSYPQSPDCIPPIDPMAIHEIENQARLVADSLDHMMGNLRNNLHQMSAISVGCEEAYKTSVDVTCDSVDASIKSMYALMAKCEELSMAMQPVYKLADQIREIKRLLDRFESQLGDKP